MCVCVWACGYPWGCGRGVHACVQPFKFLQPSKMKISGVAPIKSLETPALDKHSEHNNFLAIYPNPDGEIQPLTEVIPTNTILDMLAIHF